MALPTILQLKANLRVQTTAEDATFTLWLARATALIEGLLGRPIVAASAAHIVRPTVHCITGRAVLYVPGPLTAASLVLKDPDDATVSSSTYTVTDSNAGLVTFDADASIALWYTATAPIGWSAHTAYATKYEPLLAQAITDTVADWYQRRNAGATSESESSANVTYQGHLGLPARVLAALDPMLRKGIR
jgi:hypothetical protein